MTRFASLTAVGALALALTVLPALPVSAQDEPTVSPDQVVATVDGMEITLGEVLRRVAELPQQITQQYPQEVLIQLIAEQVALSKIMVVRAEAADLDADETFQERLAASRADLLSDYWLEQEVESRITEAALEEAYEGFLAENPPRDEVRARHILVEEEATARDLIAELESGADFATLAQENSTGPSGPQGGDLGYFTRGQMVEPFGDAAFTLEPGEYTTEPVETQFGWHVILVEDRRTVEPPALEEVEGQLRNELSRPLINEILQELRAEAEIVVLDPEGNPIEPAAQ